MTCFTFPFADCSRQLLADEAGLASVRAVATCVATSAATAAAARPATARTFTLMSSPPQFVGRWFGRRFSLIGEGGGGDPVKGGLRSDYRPLGRAAPKKRPPSDFTKPIRSYMSWSVGSEARRAFSAP